MPTIGVLEARNALPRLITEVEGGAELCITRRGRPVARLVPADPMLDRARARRAAAGLREASAGLSLDGLSLKAMIAAGRR
ncbi:MAG: type II toxin-antitoxin system Phd/YefM family antitoxin [Acetobacteraceae bacterium]